MKTTMKTIVFLTAFVTPLALAAESALPPVTTAGSVSYVSGGVGSDEALALRQELKNYPLGLIFSEGKRGAYLADVHVTLKDEKGRVVLDTVSGGPIMLVKVAPGNYKVSAQVRGTTRQRDVSVPAGSSSSVVFNWPSKEVDPW